MNQLIDTWKTNLQRPSRIYQVQTRNQENLIVNSIKRHNEPLILGKKFSLSPTRSPSKMKIRMDEQRTANNDSLAEISE